MSTRMCPPCREGKHNDCEGIAFNESDQQVKCPCRRCYPPEPEKCTACGRPINPFTAECSGCSD